MQGRRVANAAAVGDVNFGTDSLTKSGNSIPQDFYIGKTGQGGKNTPEYVRFNYDAATTAGFYNTHSYWWLLGPEYKDLYGTKSKYNWGRFQAERAVETWWYSLYAGYVGGRTIFADVEPGEPEWSGWFKPGDENYKYGNQKVVEGFIDGIYDNPYVTDLIPGIYTQPNFWKERFGTEYKTPRSAVVWVTGCATCEILCAPCESCTTHLTEVAKKIDNDVVQTKLGGNKAVIWQYWIDTCEGSLCPGADYDATKQDPYYAFVPISRDKAFINKCT